MLDPELGRVISAYQIRSRTSVDITSLYAEGGEAPSSGRTRVRDLSRGCGYFVRERMQYNSRHMESASYRLWATWSLIDQEVGSLLWLLDTQSRSSQSAFWQIVGYSGASSPLFS